jgi:hypothetical protein
MVIKNMLHVVKTMMVSLMLFGFCANIKTSSTVENVIRHSVEWNSQGTIVMLVLAGLAVNGAYLVTHDPLDAEKDLQKEVASKEREESRWVTKQVRVGVKHLLMHGLETAAVYYVLKNKLCFTPLFSSLAASAICARRPFFNSVSALLNKISLSKLYHCLDGKMIEKPNQDSTSSSKIDLSNGINLQDAEKLSLAAYVSSLVGTFGPLALQVAFKL